MAELSYFKDDHNRTLRVAVDRSGNVSLHLMEPDTSPGYFVSIPYPSAKAVNCSIESPFTFKELRDKARHCPLSVSEG
jgi:hypothetical protein